MLKYHIIISFENKIYDFNLNQKGKILNHKFKHQKKRSHYELTCPKQNPPPCSKSNIPDLSKTSVSLPDPNRTSILPSDPNKTSLPLSDSDFDSTILSLLDPNNNHDFDSLSCEFEIIDFF